jgi:arylsulfatase A-like enzyme
MNILFVDIDTLRPDHLGCYGYTRRASPNIDAIAADGLAFDDFYCSDAPCLPSRAALFTGRFGFQTGVVGHGGTAADMRLEGAGRSISGALASSSLPAVIRRHGMHTASFSTFAERHGAWWYYAGFNECYNIGKRGFESAEEVTPLVLDWLDRQKGGSWFAHVHYWDPHTPYRMPLDQGNPFEDLPLPGDWMTPELLAEHNKFKIGPHSSMELQMYNAIERPALPRMAGSVTSMEGWRRNMDAYDCGVLWADRGVGQIVEKLKKLGAYEETAVIVTSDHGESIGELGIYDEHGTADYSTTHIPFVIKWPGGAKGKHVGGLQYGLDLLPTIIELLGEEPQPPFPQWNTTEPVSCDGESFAKAVLSGENAGRSHLALSQCAHVCQRAIRFGDFIYIRTYHDGMHLFNDEMLFNIKEDPHETEDLAERLPELCQKGASLLEKWTASQLEKNPVDPLWTVMSEGGPYHANGDFKAYLDRLEQTGRGWAVEELKKRHPKEFS